MSIFVNPTQFNDPADLAAYPRDEQADAELAAGAGVDLLFAPAPDEVYPPGFSATVQLHGPIVESLEGARRGAGHFRGVTTVVSKLLGMAAAGPGLLRPEGRPAGQGGPRAGRRPEHRHRDRHRAHGPGARRAGDVQPQPPAEHRSTGRRRSAVSAALLAAQGARGDGGAGRRRRCSAIAARRAGRATGSIRSTWPWSTPRHFLPVEHARAGPADPGGGRGPGRHPADRQRAGRARVIDPADRDRGP